MEPNAIWTKDVLANSDLVVDVAAKLEIPADAAAELVRDDRAMALRLVASDDEVAELEFELAVGAAEFAVRRSLTKDGYVKFVCTACGSVAHKRPSRMERERCRPCETARFRNHR